MDYNNVQRIILKEDDVILLRVPPEIFANKEGVLKLHAAIRSRLHPRKNKILILPTTVELSVIGKEQIDEYITNIDLWQLWDENGTKVNET